LLVTEMDWQMAAALIIALIISAELDRTK
jgi:hypothetical protein